MADVTTLCGAFQATSSEALQVKIIGCLGPIAARQGHIEMNKVRHTLNRVKSGKRGQTDSDASTGAGQFVFASSAGD